MSALESVDYVPFFHGFRKVKILTKLRKDDSLLTLLEEIGRLECLSREELADAFRFVQTILYKCRLKESSVEARIRPYKGRKRKISEALPQI